MGKYSDFRSDVEREYDEFFENLFLKGELRKCGSTRCIGNSYLIKGEEFLAPDGKAYCSKNCHKNYIAYIDSL